MEAFRINFLASETYLLPETKQTNDLINILLEKDEWVDTSGKSEPPPDFYCPKQKLMMEVMRIDDHAHKNKKGKISNPANERESLVQKELQNSGFLKEFPNASRIICNPNSGLPTKKDHNYIYYRKNFVRAVEKHKSKIQQYRDHHPGFKLVFFVFDESSAYCQLSSEVNAYEVIGNPHCHWIDRAFLSTLIDSDVDFLVWYAPNKLIEKNDGEIVHLPKTCLFDIENVSLELRDYDEACMLSLEK